MTSFQNTKFISLLLYRKKEKQQYIFYNNILQMNMSYRKGDNKAKSCDEKTIENNCIDNYFLLE